MIGRMRRCDDSWTQSVNLLLCDMGRRRSSGAHVEHGQLAIGIDSSLPTVAPACWRHRMGIPGKQLNEKNKQFIEQYDRTSPADV